MRVSDLSAVGASLLSFGAVTAAAWPSISYKTGPWEPPQLDVTKTEGADKGLIFIPVRNSTTPTTASTAVTIYDNDGHPVYIGPEQATMDFKVQSLFGEDVIVYWSGQPEIAGGYGYGSVHILDKTYKEIYTITLNSHTPGFTRGDFVTANGEAHDSYIDVHEHYITSSNTLIVSALNVTQHNITSVGGGSDGWITDGQFYEIDIATNKVIFSWSALDHQDMIPLSSSLKEVQKGVSRATPWDPYHLNSVAPTKEGYIVSIRFFGSAFYLNKNGSVRWQFSGTHDGTGDFVGSSGNEISFSWQHQFCVYNETSTGLILSFFNNANTMKISNSESTGMAYEVDLLTRTASLLYNVTDPNEALYTLTQGSFQFLGAAGHSNIFIGYGNIPVVKEYNSDGAVVLSARFGVMKVAEAYRVFKHPWVGTPHWKPAVVVETDSTGSMVYMSWNGATEYDSWALYSVPSPSSTDLTLLGMQRRDGLETQRKVHYCDGLYIKVAARRGNDILAWSEAVKA